MSEFLQRHLSKPVRLNRAIHADLFDADQIFDDVIVVSPDPRIADLNVHGGQWVVQTVLDLAAREGFHIIDTARLPLPIQATDAATPLEQEIEAYLPMAKTELGIRTLLSQKDRWRELLQRASNAPPDLHQRLEELLADHTLIHLLYPPTAAIVGPANVGKSTLANQLFSRERSITADVPGTTRDWVGEIANIDGLPVLLLDTPGLRQTHDPVEAAAIDRSRDQIARATLVILVLDATRPLAGEQAALLSSFPDALNVINKSDRPTSPDLNSVPALRTVATTGQGLDLLRAAITSHFCGKPSIDPDRPRIWTERQRGIVTRALGDSAALDELFHARNPADA